MKPARKKFSPKVYAEICRRQGFKCACGCEEPLGDDPRDIEFDHELDLAYGGEDTPENLRALKKRHHLTKTTREAKNRAKADRIKKREGLMKKRMSERDRAVMKMLEAGR